MPGSSQRFAFAGVEALLRGSSPVEAAFAPPGQPGVTPFLPYHSSAGTAQRTVLLQSWREEAHTVKHQSKPMHHSSLPPDAGPKRQA